MIKSFMEGEDIHKATAALMNNVPYDSVTKDMRSAAKAITFGLMYGKSPAGYAVDEGISIEEAEAKFEQYFQGKPLIKKAIDDAQNFVKEHGYIEVPISGFRRKLAGINSSNYADVQSTLRKGFNTVIQSASATISTMALIRVNKWLKNSKLNANLMVTVHDSLTVSTTHEDAPMVAKGIKYIMEHLPIPEIQFEYNGRLVDDFMQAQPGFGMNYGFEAEVEPEEFATFKTTKGFHEFYFAKKYLLDQFTSKLINEETYEVQLAELESKKSEYQNM